MNKQEIINVLRELHKITGFRISLHGADFEEIAAYPENSLAFCALVNENKKEHSLCLECDRIACTAALNKKSTHIYKCRYGLTEAASPLYSFDTLTGFLMMGQIAENRIEANRAEEILTALIGTRARGSSENIPTAKSDMIDSYVKIMTMCAQYLTLSNLISSTKPSFAEKAREYIRKNLSNKFTIPDICKSIGCSKSTLLTTFKKKYGITINSYVTNLRLERAAGLLRDEKKSVAQIASEAGFADQSYFSKVFSAKYGIPPTEYRAALEEESFTAT